MLLHLFKALKFKPLKQSLEFVTSVECQTVRLVKTEMKHKSNVTTYTKKLKLTKQEQNAVNDLYTSIYSVAVEFGSWH